MSRPFARGYEIARWHGTTPVHAERGSIGLSFHTDRGEIRRVEIPLCDVRHVVGSLADALVAETKRQRSQPEKADAA